MLEFCENHSFSDHLRAELLEHVGKYDGLLEACCYGRSSMDLLVMTDDEFRHHVLGPLSGVDCLPTLCRTHVWLRDEANSLSADLREMILQAEPVRQIQLQRDWAARAGEGLERAAIMGRLFWTPRYRSCIVVYGPPRGKEGAIMICLSTP